MKFFDPSLETQYAELCPRLRTIASVLEALMIALYQKDLLITSVFRPDPASPHAFYRALDARSFDLFDSDCLHLLNLINLIFPYGKTNLQTMIWHNAGRGWHFHLQVKP